MCSPCIPGHFKAMRLFVDNLTNVDFSYLCPRRGLVGETWLASIELTGPLDEQGMVCDFGVVKKQLRQWLDHTLDHKLLVPAAHHDLTTKETPGKISVRLGQTLSVESPQEAIIPLPINEITPLTVARWCEQALSHAFRAVDTLRIRFTTEAIDGPFYHYSHGLKKHNGNCQRIAHGHRSKLLVWRDDALDLSVMTRWAQLWEDIYLATREDCVKESNHHFEFAYAAPQGHFTLSLPRNRCYFLDTDTTVEHIAQHIADTLAAAEPGHRFRVQAFEGIGKGAIAEAYHS